MKLLSIDMARVGAIVRLEELTPLESMYPPRISQAIAARYSFLEQPNWAALSELQDKRGMEFRVGKFQSAHGNEVVIQDLIIAPFGVVANTYSTKDSEELLNDLFHWADEEYKTRFYEAQPRFFFLSQLVVQLDHPVLPLIQGFETITREISKAVAAAYGQEYPIDITTIAFDFDRTSAVEEMRQLAAFGIERQTGKPHIENRFFSVAPLPTESHIALLEQVESQLKNTR